MGGACSIGVKDSRISSDEVDNNNNELQIIKNNNNLLDNNLSTNNNKKKNYDSINNNLKRMKSFGGLNKKKNNKVDASNNQPPAASPQRFFSGEIRFTTDDKMAPRGSSFIGRASVAGLEKAVDVLDALGSGMANLNSGGFLTGKMPKSNKISILAFEVANTISRGEKLMQSLSKESVKFIKGEVIPSEGVQYLVSEDTKVLLCLAALDKREELDVFCKEVTRFGNHCKDPQWHNLDRYFQKLDSESAAYKQEREQAEAKMQDLVALAENTSELYHELNAFDRFEQDYRQKVEEMKSLNLPRKGEHLMMLNSELRQQKKIVMSLKRKSLWSRKLEEVIEKLVEIVAFIRQEITEVFGTGGVKSQKDAGISTQRLGPAGLALHYANVINQMDNIASRPTSLPPNVRDTLYRGLPESVKAALRTKLRKDGSNKDLDVPHIKAEMEKILEWLAPMAMNTLKVHQGFGWVGEWANASTEFSKKTPANGNLIRLQTLYHADKEKTDTYILTLVTFLHQLISGIKNRDYRCKTSPLRTSSEKILVLNSPMKIYPSIYDGNKTLRVELSEEDRKLLERMSKSRSGPGLSKSQELGKPTNRVSRSSVSRSCTWSRSMENSPYREQRVNLPEVLDGSDLELTRSGIEAPF